MNARERLLSTVHQKPLDRGVLWPDGFWEETRNRWLQEGMPEDYDFGFDFPRVLDVQETGIQYNYLPPWDTKTTRDLGEYELNRNEYGILVKTSKNTKNRGIVQYLSFPVSSRDDWEQIKPRLDPEIPDRYPADWAAKVQQLKNTNHPVGICCGHLGGFFSFLRELFGDEEVYFLLNDDPPLAKEIVDYQVYRLTSFVRKITKSVSVDSLMIWEDMCYKNGPLVSPEMFRQFFLEPYQRTISVAGECGIPMIDVDSDGNTMKLLPLWLEAGINMHHPIEVASGMDAVEIKRTFGECLTIHGGIDKRVLAMDVDAIDREFERIRPAYEMGGYIPHVDHAVPYDVPWSNYQYYLEKRRALIDNS